MREIKFRAWSNNKKELSQPFDLSDIAYNYDSGYYLGFNMSFDIESDDVTLMQYTGLKDKNGVEIYEGDIVSLDGSITGAEGLNPGFLFTDEDKVEIAWDESIAAWSLAGKLDRTDRVEVTYRNHAIQLIHNGVCEVIGNIYENPELIK